MFFHLIVLFALFFLLLLILFLFFFQVNSNGQSTHRQNSTIGFHISENSSKTTLVLSANKDWSHTNPYLTFSCGSKGLFEPMESHCNYTVFFAKICSENGRTRRREGQKNNKRTKKYKYKIKTNCVTWKYDVEYHETDLCCTMCLLETVAYHENTSNFSSQHWTRVLVKTTTER